MPDFLTNENVFDTYFVYADTSSTNKQIKSETAADIFVAGNDEDNHLNNGEDESEFDSSEERLTKDAAELIIPSYFDTSCDKCHAIFQTLSEARTHYIDQHDSFNGYVKCCGKRFKKRSHVTDHILWHQNPNSFMCNECNKSFDAKYRLAAHMLRHEPEESKKFQCTTCEKRFSKKFLLNKHISLVHSNENQNIVCHLCDKK